MAGMIATAKSRESLLFRSARSIEEMQPVRGVILQILGFAVGAGTKPDRDGSKPDSETEQNRILIYS
jgi:hypothetical protein